MIKDKPEDLSQAVCFPLKWIPSSADKVTRGRKLTSDSITSPGEDFKYWVLLIKVTFQAIVISQSPQIVKSYYCICTNEAVMCLKVWQVSCLMWCLFVLPLIAYRGLDKTTVVLLSRARALGNTYGGRHTCLHEKTYMDCTYCCTHFLNNLNSYCGNIKCL